MNEFASTVLPALPFFMQSTESRFYYTDNKKFMNE